MNQIIAAQLRKALECKDEKELRAKIEAILDMLNELPEPIVQPVVQPSKSPTVPILPWYDSGPTLEPPYKFTCMKDKE